MYYEVKGTNLRIAGSMHLFPADSPQMPDWLWEAYKWSEHLVIESDPNGIRPYCSLPEGVSLSTILPASVMDVVTRYWPTDGSFAKLQILKPWVVLLALPRILFPQVPGVEAQFLGRVATDHKPVATLESSESLARLLDALPSDLYAKGLNTILSNPEIVRTNILSLHRAWLSGDVAELLNVVSKSPLWQLSGLKEVFIDRRNRAWMDSFRAAFNSPRRTLILVGAIHLCGEDSVIKLTEKEGHILSSLF